MVDGENRETPHCNTKGASFDRTINPKYLNTLSSKEESLSHNLSAKDHMEDTLGSTDI